jgi:two-component system, chemotaxis family, protein-glutamate methylesterase/glutaminase
LQALRRAHSPGVEWLAKGGQHTRDIVVIGASADGVQTLKELVRPLPADLPASLFVVLHTRPSGGTILPRILSRAGKLPADLARDGERAVRGRIYVAPADHHLLLTPRAMRLVRGPRENGFRPGIDPLFRSAARAFGPRVLGIILSGMLDDGAFGLREVADRGGMALVQDPFEATHSDMPRAALVRAPSARSMTVATIAETLIQLANGGKAAGATRGATVMTSGSDKHEQPPVPDPIAVPDRLEKNSPVPLGAPTVYTCPDCGGTLLELVEGELVRYRCHAGHGYTPMTLLRGQEEAIEDALWNALRALEESAALRRRSAERAGVGGLHGLAATYATQSDELEQQAHTIRSVLERPLEHPADEAELPVDERGKA